MVSMNKRSVSVESEEARNRHLDTSKTEIIGDFSRRTVQGTADHPEGDMRSKGDQALVRPSEHRRVHPRRCPLRKSMKPVPEIPTRGGVAIVEELVRAN
ncbi:hypothetical protein YC2023_019377 [Brassica napus]